MSTNMEANRIALAMCAAASREDWDGWSKLMVEVPPSALIGAFSTVGEILAKRLAECLAMSTEDLYQEVLLDLAKPALGGGA